MVKKTIFFLCSLFFLSNVRGQDLHFTYFEFAPQSISPALMGNFSGSYRAAAIIRDQYGIGGGVNGYRTVEAQIDAPIIRGIRKRDWIGVGLSFDQDTRGTFALTDTYSRLGLGYHLAFNKEQTRYLSIGVQKVSVSRKIDRPAGSDITGFQIKGGGNDPDLTQYFMNTNENGNVEDSFSDWVGGVSISNITKTGKLSIGVTATHFIKNNVSFSTTYDLPFRMSGFMLYDRAINDRMSIEPAVLIQSMSSVGFEASCHAVFGYKLKEEGKTKLKAGLGFRTGTSSAQFLVGADIKGIKAGFSYDLPLSGFANASGVQNALEIGISYIGIIKKTPKVKPTLICPRL